MPHSETESTCAINMVRSGPTAKTPIVFLHPVGLDLTWWGPQFDAFSGEREVAAFDMPGHGRSATPKQPLSFDLMADALEGVVNSLGDQPVHLVGLSVGGMIAQAFTLRRPEWVASLALVGTLCTFPPQVRAAIRERAHVARTEGMARIAQQSNERWFPADLRKRRPDITDRVIKILSLQPGEYHGRMWDMIAGLDFEEQLAEVRCPSLVVTGSEDINAPVEAAQKIADRIRNARLEVMQGLGHFPPFEAPAAFNDLLKDFLDRTEAEMIRES